MITGFDGLAALSGGTVMAAGGLGTQDS